MGIKTKHGFALPTVMITSVVMLTMLLTGLVTVSSANVSIRNQYYDQLAKEAAESGVNFVLACIRATTIPSAANTYTPQSTSCSNNAADTGKSAYVMDTTSLGGTIIKTRYTVNGPTTSAGGYYEVSSTGYAELYRTSSGGSGSPWLSVSKKVDLRIQYQSLFPNYSTSGALMVCGLINAETYCWGRNQDGRLGNGTLDPVGEGYEADTDLQLGLYSGGNPIITKVVRPNDTVEVGGNTLPAPNRANSQMLDHDINVAAGGEFGCAITTTAADAVDAQGLHADRKVVCWGDTTNGQLGNGNSSGSYIPYPVNTTPRWATTGTYAQYPSSIIDTNGGTGCIITERRAADSDGNTWCWGANWNGTMGQNTLSTNFYTTPRRVYHPNGSSSGVVLKDIAANSDARHICGILDANNRAVCWGRNEFGELGVGIDGTAVPASFRIPLPSVVINTNNEDLYVNEVAPGGTSQDGAGHTCAITRTNANSPNTVGDKIYCWGSNAAGELGLGVTNNSHYTRANLVTTIRDIAGNTTTDYTATRVVSSNLNSCAIISVRFSGAPLFETNYHTELACWGENVVGQVGVGQPGTYVSGNLIQSIYNRPTVVPFFTGKTVSAMNGGAFRFCAIVGYSNYCWGRDQVGQVGDGVANTAEYTPSKSTFLEPDFVGLTY